MTSITSDSAVRVKLADVLRKFEKIRLTRASLDRLVDLGIFTVQEDRPGGARFYFEDEFDYWFTTVGTFEQRKKKLLEYRRERDRL
jgi:hypothetical protein